MISGIGVFYPDKAPTQRIGIVPNVEVEPTIAGIRAGRDEVLEEALRQILGRGVSAAEIESMAEPRLARSVPHAPLLRLQPQFLLTFVQLQILTVPH